MDSETVTGRLMMTGFSAEGSQILSTSLQISAAKSISVPVKDSGLYSKRMSLPAIISLRSFKHCCAPVTAISITSSFVLRNTCCRWAKEVGL